MDGEINTLFGLFFPAVTGFTAGVAMSGDLKNPKISIPWGTMLSITIGLSVYLILSVFICDMEFWKICKFLSDVRPVLRITPQTSAYNDCDSKFSILSGGQSKEMETLTDMDSVVSAEFKAKLPGEIAKALLQF